MLQSHFPIDNININDFIYNFSYPIDNTTSILSYNNNFYYTPIIIEKHNNSYRVIEGYSRLKFLISKDVKHIQAVIHQDDNTLNLFITGIISTLNHRKLNIIEKGIILSKLQSQFNQEKDIIINKILPLIQENQSINLFKQFIQLNNLIDDLKMFIINHNIQLSIAHPLSEYPVSDQEIIFHWINHLKLSVSQIKIWLDTLHFLTKKNRLNALDLLKNTSFNDILTNAKSNKTSLQKIFFDEWNKIRYPRYEQHSTIVHNRIKDLKLPQKIKIQPPKHFEGQGIEINIKISSIEDYNQILNKLIEIKENQTMNHLFNAL